MFAGIMSPDGFLSNISRCVRDNGKKISGMKSHDHVFIEQLLPLATRGFLPKEMIFPPAFYDVMVHLVVHLAAEAKIEGPVRYRWIYPISWKFKEVHSKQSTTRGLHCRRLSSDECLTFCSRYMSDIDTKFNRKGRNDDDTLNDVTLRNKLDIFRPLGHALGEGAPRHLSFEECDQIHLYNLLNCDELIDFVNEHKLMLERENPRNVERRHKMLFATWIHDRVRKLYEEGNIDEDMCENRKTQNSGVMVRGDDISDKEYYGVLKDIFEVSYPGGNRSNLYSNVVGEHVGSSNLVQNGGNYNVPRRSISSSNQVQSMGNCDLPNHNVLGSLNHLEHCQIHDDNMISNENQFQNESERCISPHVGAGTSSKRKRTTNLAGRMNMNLEATNALDPPIRRDEENRGVGENANRRQAIGENGRLFVNECGCVVRTRAPLNVKSWKEAFGLAGDMMWKKIETCENNGVKLSADVIWLFEHTKKKEGQLQWADDSRSKEIYDQLKVAVATHEDSMTQEVILLDVLKPRCGYFCGKEETQEQTKKQLQGTVEATSRQLEQQKLDMQPAMDAMKEEL
uniref:DUF4218 domain-containing protein n=1 Tax=Chenopodium quinoa TaxID=63459 RepID=A0A803MRD3_CHEQI